MDIFDDQPLLGHLHLAESFEWGFYMPLHLLGQFHLEATNKTLSLLREITEKNRTEVVATVEAAICVKLITPIALPRHATTVFFLGTCKGF